MGRSGDLPRLSDGAASRADGGALFFGHPARSSKAASVNADLDADCTILHVDMDAFFVAVALREYPELRGKPVVVGGVGNRGVVSSASYEARAFGVRSAMPVARARRLCPQVVCLPVPGAQVREASRAVMEIFRSFTPVVEPLSVDEAFLDVSGGKRLWGQPSRIGELIRARVHSEQGLTCSVGGATTKFIAKLASTRCKPNGLLVVPSEHTLEFLHPLPVHALWGVGERTQARLEQLGLRTVGELARYPLASLRRTVGAAAATHLHELAWARDPRSVTTSSVDKSIGCEHTFDEDVTDPEIVRRQLLRLAEKVAARIRRAGYLARTISVKVRLADFTTLNRSRTLDHPTDLAGDLYNTACQLVTAVTTDSSPVRLVGIRGENLRRAEQGARQLELGSREYGWREAEQAIDKVVLKFGDAMVSRATLVRPKVQKPQAMFSRDEVGPQEGSDER